MSISLETAAAIADTPDKARIHRRVPDWMREPLLHFLLIGAALFALDGVLAARQDDPRHIVVGAAVDAEARQTFQAARGRPPTGDELRALRQVWIDNEVLYREGIAMGLDKGDTAIRERVIFKALSMVDAGTKRPRQRREDPAQLVRTEPFALRRTGAVHVSRRPCWPAMPRRTRCGPS